MARTVDAFGVLQDQFDYPAWAKWVFANIPFVMRAYRSLLMARVLILSRISVPPVLCR